MFNNVKFYHCQGCKTQQQRKRIMQLEALEERAMLSVSPLGIGFSESVPPIDAPIAVSQLNIRNNDLVADLSELERPTLNFAPKLQSTGNTLRALHNEPTSVLLGSSNYDAHDVAKLQDFLEQIDSSGIKNGTKLDVNYNVNDPITWNGVMWTEINGVNCLAKLFLSDNTLIGSLDLSGCTKLTEINISENSITIVNLSDCVSLEDLTIGACSSLTTLNVSSCPSLAYTTLADCHSLTSLDFSNNTAFYGAMICLCNSLSSLNFSGCSLLEHLLLDNCPSLDSLDISNCTSLKYFYCMASQIGMENQIASIDLSTNTLLDELVFNSANLTSLDLTSNVALKGLDCWGPNLNKVALSSERNNDIIFSFSDPESWIFTDLSGEVLDESFKYTFTSSTSFPIYATNGSQTIEFTECTRLPSPSLTINSLYADFASFKVSSVENASGYLLEYSTSPNFKETVTINVSTEVTVSGLAANTTYYFRVRALGTGNYTNSTYSVPITIETQSSTLNDLDVLIVGKKVALSWSDNSPTADAVRYRPEGTTRWTTRKLQAGVTNFSFNATAGVNYEIEVLPDQQESKALKAKAVVLEQAKLSLIKNSITDSSFDINVTNYGAKNLATNATKAIVTVNGVQTALDIVNHEGTAALLSGGKVSFSNGMFTFTEMMSNTQYKVQVSFSDGISDSTISTNINAKTAKSAYLTPQIVSAYAYNSTSVVVEWETAYGKNSDASAQLYTVQYSTDGVRWTNVTTRAMGNSFTIVGLKSGEEYYIRVSASKDTDFDASGFSEVLITKTLALPKTLLNRSSITDEAFVINVPNYLNTNLASATTLNVKSDKYGIATIDLNNGTGSATFFNGMKVTMTNGTLTFTNVPSLTQQKIQINFSDGVCTTAWSQAVTVKTTISIYNKPVLKSAFAIDSRSVVVEWETAYGKNSSIGAQFYTVQYSTDGIRWTNATVRAVGDSFTITRLKPNTKYLVAVIANKDQLFNASVPSESLLVMTSNAQ